MVEVVHPTQPTHEPTEPHHGGGGIDDALLITCECLFVEHVLKIGRRFVISDHTLVRVEKIDIPDDVDAFVVAQSGDTKKKWVSV
jgi:hypothetical protein